MIPPSAKHRLDTNHLPVTQLDETEITTLLRPHIFTATDKPATRLLQTPTRNSNIRGPELRKAHERVGFYLSNEYVAELLGTESYPIPHVQNKNTEGHCLRDEDQTLIVPLMRGGEPLALGVSEAFPSARFCHAKGPEDVNRELLLRSKQVLLVDFVVNTGASMIEFVRSLRNEAKFEGEIVMVVGVVQQGAIEEGGFADMLRRDTKLSLVALRASWNKYQGKGGSDTGNRLFNTTELD
ncbi:hypothetical protein DM02DRAFT_616834 [Periconia macrospinosa]|uniref:Phosphoribosyltransferase domain-containing protein n=1 Tax=Periconia macrospinosa TaxID=97972 RepID=A0A2V1DFS3_9PLEO|nr:hypothetical protein DM02DRAFT_616834 [Periconia macrospinosa]